jgi:hypothetical protein
MVKHYTINRKLKRRSNKLGPAPKHDRPYAGIFEEFHKYGSAEEFSRAMKARRDEAKHLALVAAVRDAERRVAEHLAQVNQHRNVERIEPVPDQPPTVHHFPTSNLLREYPHHFFLGGVSILTTVLIFWMWPYLGGQSKIFDYAAIALPSAFAGVTLALATISHRNLRSRFRRSEEHGDRVMREVMRTHAELLRQEEMERTHKADAESENKA